MTRLLCWLGLHDDAVTTARGGYVRFRACRREGCPTPFSIRKGYR